jgi:hypothetical protein
MRRLGLAIVIAATFAAGVAQAGGEPAGRSAAAANTLVATIVNTTNPEDNNMSFEIRGQVTAPSRKFAPRKCRAERTFDVHGPTVGGGNDYYGSSYPTPKSGRFRITFPAEYAYTLEDGSFHDGAVPLSGGTATFVLHTGRLKVQRTKGNPFATYTCRPLSITLQAQVAAVPQD